MGTPRLVFEMRDDAQQREGEGWYTTTPKPGAPRLSVETWVKKKQHRGEKVVSVFSEELENRPIMLGKIYSNGRLLYG